MNKIFLIFVLIKLCFSAKNYDYEFVKVELLNGAEEYFTHTSQIQKVNSTAFNVHTDVNLLTDIDDTYKMEMKTYISENYDDNYEQYAFKMNEMTFCEFMKTIYKTYLYPKLKDASNFPHYDTCPVLKGEYKAKDYVANMEKYNAFLKPGTWRVEILFAKGDDAKKNVNIYGTIKELAE